LGIAESDRIHGYGAILAAEQREHFAKFVPGARRLMQQQDRAAGAAGGDMDEAGADGDEGPFDH
jgi:hypothetical protein